MLKKRAVRRSWMVAAAVMLSMVAGGAVALAAEGPHGPYSVTTTDACASCHRAHTGIAPKLLINSNTALCLTCHGSAGTGADTDVIDGLYGGTTAGTDGHGLNGGGFRFATQDTDLTGTISGTVTSLHSVQGEAGYSSTAIMWGAGSSGSGPGGGFDLYCTSCHDPHGSSNYRMLRTIVNGVPVTVTETETGTAAKSFTTPTYYLAAGQWEISSFCSACHTRYMATAAGSGATPSGDAAFGYRHRVDAPSGGSIGGITFTFPAAITIPVSTSGGAPMTAPDNRTLVCVTCHVAHGTKAKMAADAGRVPWPGGASGPSGDARSALLRLDNRGVCQVCHQK